MLMSSRTCTQCFRIVSRSRPSNYASNLYRSSIHTKRKIHDGAIVPDQDVQKNMRILPQLAFKDYFSANESLDRGWLRNGLLAVKRTAQRGSQEQSLDGGTHHHDKAKSSASVPTAITAIGVGKEVLDTVERAQSAISVSPDTADSSILPHRRRQARKQAEQQALAQQEPATLSAEDASSRLTTVASASTSGIRRKLATYLSLSKPRLSFLILLTTTSAYSLYPIPSILSTATTIADTSSTLSTSTLTLLFLTTGTFLSCASANAFNMLFEPDTDAKMSRTRNRPLVRKLISSRGALLFAISTGLLGLTLLEFGTNPTVAALSGLNIFLYGFVYTPLKRLSPINTWIGAIVGGIPPLMGWVAAAGTYAGAHHAWTDLLFSKESAGGWLLASLLFAWQFPHFNSLSHSIREDYRAAGLKMLAWMNPARNGRVALRYAVLMFPICIGMYSAGLVNPAFLVISSACNAWMLKEAFKFWRYQGANGSARGLFWASVWQLPLVLVGALVCKTGLWDGWFASKEDTVLYEELLDASQEEGLGMDESRSTISLSDTYRGNLSMMELKPSS